MVVRVTRKAGLVKGVSQPSVGKPELRVRCRLLVLARAGLCSGVGGLVVMNINSNSSLRHLYIYISPRQTLDIKPLYKE